MPNQWFKFYGSEYLSDPKMLALTACERSCWLTLLSYASVSDDAGSVRHLDEARLMIQAGLDPQGEEWGVTKGVIEKFKKLEMIDDDNGLITVKNWQKRQGMSLTGYERVKKWREKKRGDNEMITPEENRVEKKRITTDVVADGFSAFWQAYPRKVNKVGAWKSWKRISPDHALQARIIAAVEAHKRGDQWTKDDGRFIPHPATWLNQERWGDELRPSKRPAAGGKFDQVKSTKV